MDRGLRNSEREGWWCKRHVESFAPLKVYVLTYNALTRGQRIEVLVNAAMISSVSPKEKRPVSASQRDEVSTLW